MDIYVRDGSIIVSGVSCFDLARSCDCGQAFRWKNTGNGWFGVAGGRGAKADGRNSDYNPRKG